MRIEANVAQMQTWLGSLKRQVEELALERDEARAFALRLLTEGPTEDDGCFHTWQQRMRQEFPWLR